MKNYREILEAKFNVSGINSNYFKSFTNYPIDVSWDGEDGTAVLFFGPTTKAFSIVADLYDFSRVKIATFDDEDSMMKVVDVLKKKGVDYKDFKKLGFKDT